VDAAVRKEVTSFGTFLSTLCREFCHHLDFKKLGSVRIEGRDLGVRGPMGMPVQLHIFQLFLVHPEIVTEFVDDGQADLFAGFCLAAAGCLNILLVEDDMIGSAHKSNTLFLVVGTP
jgi:hypothetical protein